MTSNSTTITTINPATEETITTYDLMSKDAAFEKVVACHAAFLQWRTTRHEERATYLRDIAGALRRHANALAALTTAETGKLLRDGHTEVELCAQIFEYTAEHGPVQLADESRTHSGGHKAGVVAYCPIGVVYSIQPWNSGLPAGPCPGRQPDGRQRRDPQAREHLHRQWPDVA